jgi:predicted DCC family thiol-disulfide oxidoreductase YuxK
VKAFDAMNAGQIPPSPQPVLLFDDACGFCSAVVQTVLRHDKKRTLRFASLNGECGLDLRARHPELNSVDSMVWFRPKDGHSAESITIRSDAALLTADYLGGLFRLAAITRFVPRRRRDAAYDFVAHHRHKLSRTPQECLLPTPDQRSRFLG